MSMSTYSFLDSITLQDTQDTTHICITSYTVTSKSRGEQNKYTHHWTVSFNNYTTIGNTLPVYYIPSPPCTNSINFFLSLKLSQIVMGSFRSPQSLNDSDNMFEEYINPDCLLIEVPSTLNTGVANIQDNLVQQQQQFHLQRLSPLTTLERPCAPSGNRQPPRGTVRTFSESHFIATKITDLPPWAYPFDLSNFDLITPPAMLSNPLLAAPDQSIPQTTPSLHSATISTPSTPPSPALPLTSNATATATPATTTSPFPLEKPSPEPPLKKPSACTSLHCCPNEMTQNPETTHHHHHKDSKRRFCCSYAGCTSCTSYTTRKDRKRHEVSKHSVLHLVCDVCGHTTARTDNMRVHVRAAHREECEVVMKRIVRARAAVVMGSW